VQYRAHEGSIEDASSRVPRHAVRAHTLGESKRSDPGQTLQDHADRSCSSWRVEQRAAPSAPGEAGGQVVMQDALVRTCAEQPRAIEEPAVEAGASSDEHGREEQRHGAARADGSRQVA